jgi:hypothetical protein
MGGGVEELLVYPLDASRLRLPIRYIIRLCTFKLKSKQTPKTKGRGKDGEKKGGREVPIDSIRSL